MDSKHLPPRQEAFFPTIFYKTQFCERQAGLPAGLDLSAQIGIITGSNAGLGLESARQFLALGLSHLILAVRTVKKGEAAASELRKTHPRAKIEVWELDMCSYQSIRLFAERVSIELTRLDFALLNAGLVKPAFEMVEETGHEETLQVVRADHDLSYCFQHRAYKGIRTTSRPYSLAFFSFLLSAARRLLMASLAN